jgi:phosphoribosyl 1,2-cyclic phosphodiesterase
VPYTVTFWGTRGSIPTPGPHTARYGGNTPCVSVAAGGDRLVVLDAGTGIRPLGLAVDGEDQGPLNLEILLPHCHWDHIQGLPFFKPLFRNGNVVRIFGTKQDDVSLTTILERQNHPAVFPIPLRALAAKLTDHDITQWPEFVIDGFRVETFRLRHPGTTLAYRLTPTEGGASMAYVTDNELGPGGSYDVPADWRARMVKFLKGVDLLIHDGMYSDELLATRPGWGHSSPAEAVALAAEAGAKRLVFFHHEPDHDDAAIDRLLSGARAAAMRSAPSLVVDAAMEGLTFTL